MNKEVLVAGATGFLGARVCSLLRENGYTITAITRTSRENQFFKDIFSYTINADLSRADSVKTIIRACKRNITDAVFIAGSVDYSLTYQSSVPANLKTAEHFMRILGHLQERGRIKRFVFVGSVASRGFLQHEPGPGEYIDEETSYYRKGLSVYSDVKKDATDLVKKLSEEFSLDTVIAEPGSLVGQNRGNRSTTNSHLIKKILKGMPVLTGGASYTSADKAAEGITAALERGKPGSAYLLGGENMRMKDFAGLVKRVADEDYSLKTGRFFPFHTIPSFISRFMGTAGILLNPQQARLGNSFHYMNYRKAGEELGYTHTPGDLRIAVSETINEIIS